MRISSRILTLAVLAGLSAFAPQAFANTISLSPGTGNYTFAVYDPSGNPLAITPTTCCGNGFHLPDDANVGLWTATTTFTLGSSKYNVLNVDFLQADDRVALELNGTVLTATGIGGPGAGDFIFAPNGPALPQSFIAPGPQSLTFSGPFNVGLNTLELIVDNTNAGISGTTLSSGPTAVQFTGSVAVPEPASFGLFAAGIAMLGLMRRRRGACRTGARRAGV